MQDLYAHIYALKALLKNFKEDLNRWKAALFCVSSLQINVDIDYSILLKISNKILLGNLKS